MNLKRRQLNSYQTATWALKVYGGNSEMTNVAIAKKVGLDNSLVGKTKSINDRLDNVQMVDKVLKLKTELESGLIGVNNADKILTGSSKH